MTSSLISLADAKAWLRYPSAEITGPSSDDAAIQAVIDAATGIIELHTGANVPKQHVDRQNGGNVGIWLHNTPVITVESVVENMGLISYSLTLQSLDSAAIIGENTISAPTSMFAYSVDNYELGQLTRRSVGNAVTAFAPGIANIEIIYVAGRATPSAACVLACKELVAHIWQSSQLRAMAAGGAFMQYDAVSGETVHNPAFGSQIWSGLPSRVRQFLESERRTPIIA